MKSRRVWLWQGDPIGQAFFKASGISPIPLSIVDVYTSLATGVVEGAHWGDAFPMYEMKFHEVLKNYMQPEPIIGSWNTLWINMDVWKGLTDNQRNILETAALSAGGILTFNDTRARTKMALFEMQKDWEVKANGVPEAEIEKMRGAAMQVWDEIAENKDPLCKEAIDLLYEFLDEVGRGR
jgi:TRAP-type C4-dicarboxylate transport system substrate-binding protein